MTIAFTGGGSGGHFYPIIAIAEAIAEQVRERHLVVPKLYYLAPTAFDQKALFENSIVFLRIPAGKVRRYFSFSNFTDLFVTLLGTISAVFTLYRIYPDVVVSKGGYASVPTVLAARFLRIPVVIHESDAKPGRANLMAAKFAEKIAISFDSAANYFPKKVQSRIARTGIPIRKALMRVEAEGARQYLGLEPGIPTILVLGGSQGSRKINETLISALPTLVASVNIIHQTGEKLFKDAQAVAQVVLGDTPNASRYHPFNFLSETALQRAAGVADVVVARAGAGTISEIAVWKKPGILIPIPEAVSHDQRTNAYAFARTGAGIVLEEGNMTPHLLASEILRVASDKALATQMGTAASSFADPDAARILAEQILALALTHEV